MARLFKLLVVLALVSSLGLHWTLLQSVAWVGMFVSYAQTGTIREALVKTFDGQHPCSLCKDIEQGKKSEKKSDSTIEGKSLDFVDGRQRFVFCPPTAFSLLPCFDDSVPAFSFAPPVPPPRLT